MSRFAFFISNPSHHVAMVSPVVMELTARRGHECRVLSLCELRGFPSPRSHFAEGPATLVPLLPVHVRRSPSDLSPALRGRRGNTLRDIAWLGLRARLAITMRRPVDLAVLPNDAAYPFDRIARWLHKRRVPFVLMQEGIRFPLPQTTSEDAAYGSGGAAAIAAWGEASAAYFVEQGAPKESVRITGSPRFDGVGQHRHASTGRDFNTLLYLSNPIDDQGFCSTEEKLGLLARFCADAESTIRKHSVRLVVKLHRSEDEEQARRVVAASPLNDIAAVVRDTPLHELFANARAALVLASTAGLEALLFDVPLGVLEVPGYGFVHDYVQQRAAVGLPWDGSMPDRLDAVLDGSTHDPQLVSDYVVYHLAGRGDSSQRVATVIEQACRA